MQILTPTSLLLLRRNTSSSSNEITTCNLIPEIAKTKTNTIYKDIFPYDSHSLLSLIIHNTVTYITGFFGQWNELQSHTWVYTSRLSPAKMRIIIKGWILHVRRTSSLTEIRVAMKKNWSLYINIMGKENGNADPQLPRSSKLMSLLLFSFTVSITRAGCKGETVCENRITFVEYNEDWNADP